MKDATYLFHVDMANTYVRLYQYGPRVESALKGFVHRQLTKWKGVTDQYGNKRWEIDNVFAEWANDNKELRVVRALYPQLLNHLADMGLDTSRVNMTLLPVSPSTPTTFNWRGTAPLPRDVDQKQYLEFITDPQKPVTVINGTTGFGKALRNDTGVLTPTGWVPIGQLSVGDTVLTPCGKETKVMGVYPHPNIPVNKMTFNDGRVCYPCDNHLWNITRATSFRSTLLEVRKMKTYMEAFPERKLLITLPVAVNYPEKKFRIHPWVVGVLLSHDTSIDATMCRCRFFNLSDYAKETLIDHLSRWHLTLVDSVMGEVTTSWLTDTDASGQHIRYFFQVMEENGLTKPHAELEIPEKYLRGSQEQRLQLINGLMDTCGTNYGRDAPYLTGRAQKLIQSVRMLIWELGGKTARHKRSKQTGLIYMRVKLVDNRTLYSDPALQSTAKGTEKGRVLLAVDSIVPSGYADCTCIAVADPGKEFVIEGNIRTHNTIVSMIGFDVLKERVLLTLLPRHMPIWISKFSALYDIKPEDVLVVSDHDVNKLYEALKANTVNPKFIFFHLTRMRTYVKRMQEDPDSLPPLDEFIAALGCGVRVIDEAHEYIHMVYSSLLYGNVRSTWPLSATLRGDDKFNNKIYDAMFPPETILKPAKYTKYLELVNYRYRMNVEPLRIRSQRAMGYSHTLFEECVLRNKRAFEGYYKVCRQAFIDYYLDKIGKNEDGKRCLFFFSTIEMCERMYARFKKDYPDLDSWVYTGKVSKQKGMANSYNEHEVVFTTPGSCGTGKDIDKLFVVISGVMISSSQKVFQMTGRCRELTKWWPDLRPYYVMIVCDDIRRQVDYSNKTRMETFKKMHNYRVVNSGIRVW